MAAIVNWIYRTGIKRGTTGRSYAWLIVSLGAFLLRQDREHRNEPAVSMQIKPGERMTIQMRDLNSSDNP